MNDVVVCYSAPDHTSTLFTQSLTGMVLADRDHHLIADVVSVISSPRIAATRNLLVESFLAHPSDAPYLLMLDADMTFDVDLVARLLEVAHPSDRPIVGGLYFGGRVDGKITPHAYVLKAGETGHPAGFSPIEGVGEPGQWGPVVKLHGLGAGCLLMHRAALESIGKRYRETGFPWFSEGQVGGEQVGEDLAFCARAGHLGFPIHCHTGVILGHHKYGIIDEASYSQYLARRAVIGEEAVIRDQMNRLRTNGQVRVGAQ